MIFLPSKRPQASESKVRAWLNRHRSSLYQVTLLGVRGYYLNSMGAAGKNDRRMYDDAIFLVTPDKVLSFNANVDPGAFKARIANLVCGEWRYKLGIHGLSKPKPLQYQALVQAAKVTVKRDEYGHESGYFGINIHKGGFFKVSSIGCQTIAPLQWTEFIGSVKREMEKFDQHEIPYVLTENTNGPDAF